MQENWQKFEYFLIFFIFLLTFKQITAKDAEITEFPQEVALRYKSCDTCPFQHVCSGTFYKENIIISAASCFKSDTLANKYMVVAGSNIRDDNKGYVSPVERIVLHRQYKQGEIQNNVALIFLRLPLRFNDATTAATSFVTNMPAAGTTGIVAGWHMNSQAGDLLQKTNVSLLSQPQCQEVFDVSNDNVVCANDLTANACELGIGSLLLVETKLLGILVENNSCKDNTNGFVNILNFEKWINDTINGKAETVELTAAFL